MLGKWHENVRLKKSQSTALSQNIYTTKIQPETTRVVVTQAKSLQLHDMSLASRMLVNYSNFQSLLKSIKL